MDPASDGDVRVDDLRCVALVVLPPTVLMGGPLPLFCKERSASAVVLLGIVAGSWITASSYGWPQAATALAVTAAMAPPPEAWRATGRPLAVAFGLLLVPAALSGARRLVQ